MEKKRITSLLIGLLMSTFIVKVFNFAKEIEISYFYGTGEIVDKYNIIMIAPSIALSSIAPAFGIMLVARYSKERSLIIQTKEIVFIALSLLFLAITSFISINGSGDIWDWLISYLLSILFLLQVILVYYLHCFEEFNKGSFSSMIQIIVNIVVIGFSIIIKSYYILLLGLTIGLAFQLVYLVIVIKKGNISTNINIGTIKEDNFFNSFFSILLGYGLIEILISTQKFFATHYNYEGLVSAINYAYKIMNLPISILLFAVLSVLFPVMNRIQSSEKIMDIAKGLLSGISLIMLPISVILYCFSSYIISILFERGSFDADSVIETGRQLQGFALLLLPLSFYSALLRIVFIIKEYHYIYKSGLLILGTSILLNFISVYQDNITLFTFVLPIAFYSALAISFKTVIFTTLDKDFLKALIGIFFMVLSILILNSINVGEWLSIMISLMIYITSQFSFRNSLLIKLTWREKT